MYGKAKKATFNSHHDVLAALDEAERLDLEAAADVEGIDDEIALLRVKIKSILKKDPNNIKLITQATNALSRLILTRHNITQGAEERRLSKAIGNVLRDIAIPLAIGGGAKGSIPSR